MSEVSLNNAFYSADIGMNPADGTVNFGGVDISAADAAEFVMMHRTIVMKEIGADRAEMAQQHLERIREARQHLSDLGDLENFADSSKNFRGRVPITPELLDFLQNEVKCSTGHYRNRLVFYGSIVAELPQSVLSHYQLYLDRFGNWQPDAGDPARFGLKRAGGNGQWQLTKDVILVHEGNLGNLKEHVNNYIDQLNDSNNLFMTKFKSVINNMNTALEGANSLADKTHDLLKNLMSRW